MLTSLPCDSTPNKGGFESPTFNSLPCWRGEEAPPARVTVCCRGSPGVAISRSSRLTAGGPRGKLRVHPSGSGDTTAFVPGVNAAAAVLQSAIARQKARSASLGPPPAQSSERRSGLPTSASVSLSGKHFAPAFNIHLRCCTCLESYFICCHSGLIYSQSLREKLLAPQFAHGTNRVEEWGLTACTTFQITRVHQRHRREAFSAVGFFLCVCVV